MDYTLVDLRFLDSKGVRVGHEVVGTGCIPRKGDNVTWRYYFEKQAGKVVSVNWRHDRAKDNGRLIVEVRVRK